MKKITVLILLIFASIFSYGQANPIRATNSIWQIKDTLYTIGEDGTDTTREYLNTNDHYFTTTADSFRFNKPVNLIGNFTGSHTAGTYTGTSIDTAYTNAVSRLIAGTNITLTQYGKSWLINSTGGGSVDTSVADAALATNYKVRTTDSVGTIVSGVWNATSIDTAKTNGTSNVTGSLPVVVVTEGKSKRVTADTTDAAYGLTTNDQLRNTDSVGTVVRGTWQAAVIAALYGGTGISSYTVGDILYASGATTLSKLANVATGNVLLSGGVGAMGSYGKVGLTTHISGNLPVTNLNSGTNASATTYWNGNGAWVRPPYNSWALGTAALSVSQEATDDPTHTELFDEFGVTFAWAYVGIGVYRVTASTAIFAVGKTFVEFGGGRTLTRTQFSYEVTSTTQIFIEVYDIQNVDVMDGAITDQLMIFTTYP